MSNNTNSPVRMKDFIWSAVFSLIALFLFFFVYSILALFPVWNEMRNFLVSVTGIMINWMALIFWLSLALAVLCALYAGLLARRAVARQGGSPRTSIAAAALAVLVIWAALYAVLYLKTGELFLHPEYRYGWDVLAPWLLVLCAVISLGLMAFFLMKAGRSSMDKQRAVYSGALASFAFAALFAFLSFRSFSLRAGADSDCAPKTGQEVDWVNPLIGTRGGFEYGKTLPLVAAPFGMTHWTPMTRESAIGRQPYKYHHGDSIRGFLATHKPAVWMGDYGQFSLMPGIGAPESGRIIRGLPFSHRDECARPYLYSVKMDSPSGEILAEMTATERCGYLRFEFSKNSEASVTIEVSRAVARYGVAGGGPEKGDHNFPGFVKIDLQKGEISGYNTDRDSCDLGPPLPNFRGYFVIRFNRPMKSAGTWENNTVFPDKGEQSGDEMGAYAVFDASEENVVEARIGTSFISIEQARENLSREIPGWTFNKIKDEGRARWQERLSAIAIEGAGEEEREVFYTAMYRCLLFPRIFSEYGRYYSAFDDRIHNGISYNDYSLWDTFRALHPLLIFIAPDRVPGMITALIQMYEEGGWMPKWPNPTYTNIMIGTHADSVIADAYVKGVRGFDAQNAYRAMYKDAMIPPDGDERRQWGDREPWQGYEARGGLTWYKKLGYIPAEKVIESVSCTLEYAYNDFCTAQMAKALGKTEDYRYFQKRSGNFRNLYNATTGFMAPRRMDGSWDPDPLKGFTEGGPWTYLFCVMHDVPGLIGLMGGAKEFVKKLDENFSGGYYVHENEPGHHFAYLYDYAGEPWKAQEKARKYCLTKYGGGPGGLAGDEDCGQMSAWYVLSALGLYPVAPGSDEYAISSPLFAKATVYLDAKSSGKKLEIIAKNASERNKYIQSAMLNGKPLPRPFLKHGDLAKGASLVFVMGDKPNYKWK